MTVRFTATVPVAGAAEAEAVETEADPLAEPVGDGADDLVPVDGSEGLGAGCPSEPRPVQAARARSGIAARNVRRSTMQRVYEKAKSSQGQVMTGSPFAADIFGPNFELADGGQIRASSGWMPLSAMLTSEAVMERVRNTRDAIGGIGDGPRQVRAVASTMALGLFSRLLSPVLGAAVLGSVTLPADPRTTWLRRVQRGPIPLATTAAPTRADPLAALEGLVLPLVTLISQSCRLSRKVLIGDVAAAVVGSCEVIGAARPDLAGAAQTIRAGLLTTPQLRGSGTTEGPFVRSSCCLIWQLPMHYICSNCVLVDADTRMVRQRDDDRAGSAGFQRRYRRQLEEAERTHTWRGTPPHEHQDREPSS